MQKITPIKIISVALIVLLVLNLVLFTFRKISSMAFWGVIIVIALLAWKAIPVYNKIKE